MRAIILMHFLDVMTVVAAIVVTRLLLKVLWGGGEKRESHHVPRRCLDNGFHSAAM
jgi:hypothetical protein